MDTRHVQALMFLLVPLGASASAQQSPLRFKSPAKKVYYNVQITVDLPDQTTTYAGRIAYDKAEGATDKIALNYQGGLKETVARKPGAKNDSPSADPFGGGRGGAASANPFALPRTPGALRQTSAKLTLASTGEPLALEGDSQIPLPLGHLSLLVFEPLPDTAQNEWSTTNGVLLGRPARPSDGFPGDPFAKPAQPGKTAAGSETSRYSVKESRGNNVTIFKKYELKSPNSQPAFEFTGEGPLVFDREQGLFVSSQLKYQFKLTSGSIQATIPVTVDYKLLSAQEIEREEREQSLADLKLRQQDAAGGCDGIKNGHYGFHTDKQQDPWWQVDLGKSVNVSGVILYNRCNDKDMEKRADRIRILISEDGKSWTQEYEHKGPSFFGHSDQKPLKVPLSGKPARYVRLQTPGYDYLHLDEVEVYEKGNARNIAQGKTAEQSSVSTRYSNFD